VGFAVAYREIPAFLCIACDFVRPGSAARWRHMRALPLGLYGKGAACGCPCGAAEWAEAAPQEGGPGLILAADSLAAEMERRLAAHGHRYFTYEGYHRHLEMFMRDPYSSELVCLPKPASFGYAEGRLSHTVPYNFIEEDIE